MGVPFIGIVDVPLFDSLADMSFLTAHGLAPILNSFSDWPLILDTVQSQHRGEVDRLISYVFGIDVETNSSDPSLFTINPGTATVTDGIANYIDGNVTYIQNNGDGDIGVFVATQPINPGDYTSPFASYIFTPQVLNDGNHIVGGQPLNNATLTKGSYNFNPCFIGFQAPGTGASDTFVPAPFYLDIGGVVGPELQIEFDGLNTTADFANSFITCRLPAPAPFSPFQPLFDNSAVTNYGVPLTNNHYLKWYSVTGDYEYIDLFIDDTGLPGDLATLFNARAPVSWNNGFLWIVETLGAGPTGQRFELIFMDGMASQWWLVRLNPQDAASGEAVTNAVTTGWQATVDPLGILWFNPNTAATAAKMFYSFSPLEFFFPWIYPQVLNPITLPCYSTCNPVSFAQE